MKRLTVLVAFALLVVAGCDQPTTTSTEKPSTTKEAAAKPDTPATAETPAKPAGTPATPAATPGTQDEAPKKPGPCAADRKSYCADKKGDDVTACLKEHKTQLSPDCRKFLKIE